MDELLNAVLDSMVRNNILIKEMPQHLNNYLPKEEWISQDKAGAVQVSRWLAGEVEPRGGIALALQNFAELNK
jgi:hypothetical protein